MKRTSRMSDKVKAFLEKKFKEGARTGNKADPVQVAREMKILTNDYGRPTFMPEEWRTAQQISCLFSRLTSTQRQRFADSEEISEDIEAVEAEMALKDLRSLLIEDTEKTSHPTIVRGHNICELIKLNKLASLKLVALKEICEELQLITSGPLSRKKIFCQAIEPFAKNCICFQE